MSPLKALLAATAVMFCADWLEALIPEEWVRVFQPAFKMLVVLTLSILVVSRIVSDPLWCVLYGFGVAGLGSFVHQAHKALQAHADNNRQVVYMRAQELLRRR
jgi:uncharacterized membrane protein YhhN